MIIYLIRALKWFVTAVREGQGGQNGTIKSKAFVHAKIPLENRHYTSRSRKKPEKLSLFSKNVSLFKLIYQFISVKDRYYKFW